MQSGRLEQARSVADTRGKHRISAELKRIDQETRFLEEELEMLEKIDMASFACEEMLMNEETRPVPLLPLKIGPINLSSDRWFEGPLEKPGCRCSIL